MARLMLSSSGLRAQFETGGAFSPTGQAIADELGKGFNVNVQVGERGVESSGGGAACRSGQEDGTR